MARSFKTLIKNKPEGAVFFGDWHANLTFALKTLERAIGKYPDIDVFYHVGDFGLGFGDKDYPEIISGVMESAGKLLVVTGGNHEDWDKWDDLTQDQTQPYVYPGNSLVLLPKLYHWTHADRTFTSLGGASSIDRKWRNPHTSWWSQEGISEATVVSLEKSRKRSDILITHEASDTPVTPIRQQLGNPFQQMKWPYEDILVSEEQRKLVSRAIDAVQPQYHFHGHWHMPWVRNAELTTVSLGADYASYEENSFVLEKFN